jgi:xanthine dehydrogenase molybdenum-binding subunit
MRELSVVGKRLPLREGYSKVTGLLQFVPDFRVAGALCMKILRSPHAHAMIKKIDVSKAEKLAGVRAILTYEDVPQKEILCELRNFNGKILDNRVRYVGDEVAAVAADNEKIAEKALDLIKVEYEELPSVFSIEDAMKPDAPDVRGTGSNVATNPPDTGFFLSNQGWGDVEKGFAEADAIVECEASTPRIYPSPFPPACIASWEDDKVTITISHQGPFDVRMLTSHVLDIPENKIRVIAPQVAGTYGILNSAHRYWFLATLLAKKAAKTVVYKMAIEEYGLLKSRENNVMKAKLGGKKDGTITALDMDQIIDNGGYAIKCAAYGTVHDIFPHANVKYYGAGVNTNKFATGDVRGVGDVPEAVIINQAVDMLSEKLGVDPITVWKKNHTKAGDPRRGFNMPETLSTESIDELIDKGAAAIEWEKKWKGWGKPYEINGPKRRAVGMSVALHVSGIGFVPVSCSIRVLHDGTANISIGYMELGTGSKTTFAQIGAEALGLKFEDVYVVRDVDTEYVPFSMPSGASSSLHVGGSAIKVAALDAKKQLLQIAATGFWIPDVIKDGIGGPDDLDIKDGCVYVKADPERKAPIKAILVHPFSTHVIGTALRQDLPMDPVAYQTLAGFADVEVDTETGMVEVLKNISCQDSGQLINPEVCENQVFGGALQSIGYGLSEEVAFDPATGKALNAGLSDYWMPTSMDTPPMDVVFSEQLDTVGPFGAKGIGEGPTICPHCAISSAIYNAIGVRINQMPITPDIVLKALGKIK